MAERQELLKGRTFREYTQVAHQNTVLIVHKHQNTAVFSQASWQIPTKCFAQAKKRLTKIGLRCYNTAIKLNSRIRELEVRTIKSSAGEMLKHRNYPRVKGIDRRNRELFKKLSVGRRDNIFATVTGFSCGVLYSIEHKLHFYLIYAVEALASTVLF